LTDATVASKVRPGVPLVSCSVALMSHFYNLK
jgi:hypothetical protein